jgi:hypothetical protein
MNKLLMLLNITMLVQCAGNGTYSLQAAWPVVAAARRSGSSDGSPAVGATVQIELSAAMIINKKCCH